MVIEDYQGLIDFIKTTKSTCGYELIILFAAIKLKNAEGKFDKEQLTDLFLEFYRIREANDLTVEEQCNPLQFEDRKEIIQLINRTPISSLLKVGILKTFERFNPDIFKVIFDNSEEILSTIKERIIKFYLSFGDSQEIMENLLSKWETGIDGIIKKDALQKISGSIEKIDLEFMLKYLYQSYSLVAFNKLLQNFHIDQQDFENFFTGGVEASPQLLSALEQAEEPIEIEEDSPEIKAERRKAQQPSSHIQELTNFFQQMRKEAEEEQKQSKVKKKPKK